MRAINCRKPTEKGSVMGKLLLRIGSLISFIFSAAWIFRWEFIRAILYDRAFRLMEALTYDQIAQYGVPLVLVVIGIFLFHKAAHTNVAHPTPLLTGKQSDLQKEYWSLRELFAHLAPNVPLRASTGGDSLGSRYRY